MYRTGVFVNGQSPIHLMDPRIKLAAVFILSIMILDVKPVVVFIISFALIGAACSSRVSFHIIGQAIKPLLFFVGLIFIAHAFFSEGETLINIHYLNISLSRSGMEEGLLVALRFLCLIAAAIILTMTTTPSQMIAAIKYFLRPLKLLHIPVDDIAVMMMLAMRLMPVLLAEKERIETAQKARGYDLQGANLVIRLKAFISLTTTILLGVFRRADELALAMEARCYDRGERTAFVELTMHPVDYFALAILFIFSTVLTGLNIYVF